MLSTEPYGELSTPYHVLRGLQALGTSSSENKDGVSSRLEYSRNPSFPPVYFFCSHFLSLPYLFANLLHLSLLFPLYSAPSLFLTQFKRNACAYALSHIDTSSDLQSLFYISSIAAELGSSCLPDVIKKKSHIQSVVSEAEQTMEKLYYSTSISTNLGLDGEFVLLFQALCPVWRVANFRRRASGKQIEFSENV